MGKVFLNLNNNKGFKWVNNGRIYVKGYLYDKSGNLYKDKDLLGYFDISTEEELLDKLKISNGFFSVVIETNDKVFFAVDHVRSIPLFFKLEGGNLFLYDSIDVNTGRKKITKEQPEYYEFLLTASTIDANTLLPSYKQLISGEYAVFSKDDGDLKVRKYFRHIRGNFLDLPLDDHVNNLYDILLKLTERVVKASGNGTVVVPLSGGYDSRLILSGLKLYGYDNVICYNYGREGSYETDYAKEIAGKLGYELHVIRYDDNKWKSLVDDDSFLGYLKFGFNFVSVPHIQDFLALKEIYEKKLIPQDSYILPGYLGDFLGGGFIPKEIKLNKQEKLLEQDISEYILDELFYMIEDIKINDSIKGQIAGRIKSLLDLEDKKIDTIDEYLIKLEEFVTLTRLSKYTVNALRVNEYFDYKWMVPLADMEYLLYWYRVPYSLRLNKDLFYKFMFDKVFEPLGIALKKPQPPSYSKSVLLIRRFLPEWLHLALTRIYHRFTRFSSFYDVNRFKALVDEIMKQVPESGYEFHHIAAIVGYYLLHKFDLMSD